MAKSSRWTYGKSSCSLPCCLRCSAVASSARLPAHPPVTLTRHPSSTPPHSHALALRSTRTTAGSSWTQCVPCGRTRPRTSCSTPGLCCSCCAAPLQQRPARVRRPRPRLRSRRRCGPAWTRLSWRGATPSATRRCGCSGETRRRAAATGSVSHSTEARRPSCGAVPTARCGRGPPARWAAAAPRLRYHSSRPHARCH